MNNYGILIDIFNVVEQNVQVQNMLTPFWEFWIGIASDTLASK